MRSRNIKPGFYKNDLLAECDPLARILFTGLWCMADREGRLEYRAKKIKAELLPYDNCNIDKLIKQLSDKKFILIYSINNEYYIEINNFLKHQTPHIKEQASTIPAPDKNQTGTSLESLIPDSLNLIPDSLNHKPDKSGKGYPADFLSFYNAYPKHKKRDDAYKAWKSLNGTRPSIEILLQAIESQKKTKEWLKDGGEYIPYPATWLRAGSWADEATTTEEEDRAAWAIRRQKEIEQEEMNNGIN